MTVFDREMMARALRLARKGIMTVSPNPAVGCVITRGETIVGEGWHQRAGEPHAEVNAIRAAGEHVKNSTVYVTLEPCSHHGRTPPCAEALIAAGVSRVVFGMKDPNPEVAGAGIAKLRDAGVKVDGPLLEDQSIKLNRGFVKRHTQGLPWVTVKLAMSLDGRTAMASGESKWITGAAARRDVQRLRAESCAIVTGINTVELDSARLNVRADQLNCEYPLEEIRQPLRVVLDSQGKLAADAAMLEDGGRILQIVANSCTPVSDRVEQLQLASANGIDLRQVLQELANRQCNQVLVEAGATLAGAFVQAGLVDELVVYMAPTLMGNLARPLLELPLDAMAQQVKLHVQDIRSVGEDLRIICTPRQQA